MSTYPFELLKQVKDPPTAVALSISAKLHEAMQCMHPWLVANGVGVVDLVPTPTKCMNSSVESF